MTAAPDQWSWWRNALAGTPVDGQPGNPRSGFWKAPQDEPIAIWRDDAGKVCCERMLFGGGERMLLDQIDQLFASAARYPIDEATYEAARAGSPPLGYKTRLTIKECQANVVWSLELGRKKLGMAAQPAAETDVAAQAEEMPADAATVSSDAPSGPAVDLVPEAALAAEVKAKSIELKQWLASIGGKPVTKADADKLADHATLFGRLHKDGETKRVQEKEPHLTAGRQIDAKWKGPLANAESARKNCLAHVATFDAAERERITAEAARANAQAVHDAASNGDEAPAPIQVATPAGYGNVRTVATRERTVWSVDDPREYLRHLLSLNTDLPAEIVEALSKVASRRAVEAPGVTKRMERKAA